MYQAITTKYIGPTNTRGSRIKAECQARSLTMHYDDALNSDQNHIAVAKALAIKLNWNYGQFHGGALPNGAGYAFIICTGDARDGFNLPK